MLTATPLISQLDMKDLKQLPPSHLPQDLHPYINSLSDIANPSTTINPYIIATTTLTSAISYHTHLFPEYDSDLNTSMLQQLVINW